MSSATLESKTAVCVVGLESVGKSTLLESLTGVAGSSQALQGATLYCKRFLDPTSGLTLLDTPGLIRASDSATTREALRALASHGQCLVVLKAFSATRELEILWPLVRGKSLVVVLTNQDLLQDPDEDQQRSVEQWQECLGVPVALVNAKELREADKQTLRRRLGQAKIPRDSKLAELPVFTSSRKPPSHVLLDNPVSALLFLLGPALLATYTANSLANLVQPWLADVLGQPGLKMAPLAWLSEVLFGPYGLVSMMPFLFLYALPTIVLYSFFLALYKSTGLLDRLSHSLHPWISRVGLDGRDLVRVVMGFGCNVPAVVATRACHSCSRGTCVSAIAFGAACSYQLPATLAVFSAAGHPELVFSYLLVLVITTALYLRFTAPRNLLRQGRRLLTEEKTHLYPANWKQAGRDTQAAVKEFFGMAFPVFIGICVGASLLHGSGFLDRLAGWLRPAMALFDLPPQAVIAIVLGSIRKDGIAIGLLDPSWNSLKVPAMTSGQLLTSVYLAGLLLPCLVTLLTIARELGGAQAVKLAFRQAAWVVVFSIGIGWIF